jgi:hypothetical protein
MDNENKTTSGAPSSDTTSALFVSARKKQIEQQETERIAKEKEEKRLAAEAEVRRLEAEVADRKRKAEEDAKAAEEEAKRIAEESKAKIAAAAAEAAAEAKAAAAATPSAPKPAPTPAKPAPATPKPAAAATSTAASTTPAAVSTSAADATPAPAGSPIAGLLQDKKMLMILGGAVVAVIVIIVIIAVIIGSLAGGDDLTIDEYGNYYNSAGELVDENGDLIEGEDYYSSASVFDGLIPGEGVAIQDMGGAPEGQHYFTDDTLGLSFYYPDYWNAVAKRADPKMPFNVVILNPDGVEDQRLLIFITDFTKEYNAYIEGGGLDGDEALVLFLTKMLGVESLSADMFGDFAFHDVIKEENGTYSYSAEYTAVSDPNTFGWAYINVDESIGKTHAVLVTGSVSEYNFYIDDINVVTESLYSYSTAVD